MNDTSPFTNYSIPSVVPSHEPIELQQNPQIDSQEKVLIPSNDPEEIIIDDDNNNCVTHEDYEKFYNIHPNTIYNHFDNELKYTDIQDILHLENHSNDGKLYAKVKWDNQQETLIPVGLIQSDDPLKLARHIRDNPVERTQTGYWNTWARETINDIGNMTRKLQRMYKNISKTDVCYPFSRRTVRRKKKQYPIQMQTFLGVEIPRSVHEAISLDKKNQDDKWSNAMKREIEGIQEHGTFEFLPPDSEAPQGYQLAPLRMIFDVKSDLRRMARLVVGGRKVNANEHTILECLHKRKGLLHMWSRIWS